MTPHKPASPVHHTQTGSKPKHALIASSSSSEAKAMGLLPESRMLQLPEDMEAVDKERATILEKHEATDGKRKVIDMAVRKQRVMSTETSHIERLPSELLAKICEYASSSNGTRFFPRHLPAIMRVCTRMYNVGGRSTYGTSTLTMNESAGTLTHAAVALLRKHNPSGTKGVKVFRMIRNWPKNGCGYQNTYIAFEAHLSPTNTVHIPSAPSKIAATMPVDGRPEDPQDHMTRSGHIEACHCEVMAMAASVTPGPDAVQVFLETYLNRIGQAPPNMVYVPLPVRDARRCAECGSLTGS